MRSGSKEENKCGEGQLSLRDNECTNCEDVSRVSLLEQVHKGRKQISILIGAEMKIADVCVYVSVCLLLLFGL